MLAGYLMRKLILLAWLAAAVPALAQEDSRVVVGPTNPDLYEGAQALMTGDAENGVRLTLSGLGMATNRRERVIGFSNLCAGYTLLEQLDLALEYCNRALSLNDRHWRSYSNRALVLIKQKRYDEAARDLERGFSLSPGSEQLKEVRALLRDATDPVEPNIVIDDRRAEDEDPNGAG